VAATRVRLFRSLHPDRPVIPVIIGGSFPDHFPPALRFEVATGGSVTERPVTILGPDLRETGDRRVLGLAKIIAGLTGVSPDDIFRRAERERRRKVRVRNAVIGVLALLAVAATGSAAYAWQQLKTNEEFLDATLAQFTSLVDTAVTSAEACAPLTVTRSILQNAEGILEAVTKYGRDAPKIQYRKATMLAAFADNYRDIGRTETAKGRLDEAQQIMTELVRAEPGRADYLFVKAQLHGKAHGRASTRLLRLIAPSPRVELSLPPFKTCSAVARKLCAMAESSTAILQNLTVRDPDNASWRVDLAIGNMLVVILKAKTDQSETGLALARRARDSVDKLVASIPPMSASATADR